MTPAEIKKLKVPELKEQLKERGLDTTGKKDELVARLESALADEAAASAEPAAAAPAAEPPAPAPAAVAAAPAVAAAAPAAAGATAPPLPPEMRQAAALSPGHALLFADDSTGATEPEAAVAAAAPVRQSPSGQSPQRSSSGRLGFQ